jgi:predicted aminopeptidase
VTIRIAIVLALMGSALSGCGAAPYYWQAASGQWELWQKSRPIDDWLADPVADEHLKARLKQVQEIRAFASRELALPDNGSYRSYADLGRPYVVWNVFAAPELSLKPKEWCFPVAGCVGYRGYFAEPDALTFAEGLKGEGYDTYVGGVPAYSTLGWFDDPVPSTIIGYADTEIARLVFHELAHQVLYVPGDTTFNESFATAVEQEGVKRWVKAQKAPEQLAQFEQAQARRRQFIALVLEYQGKLTAIYASPASDDEKRALKAQTFGSMRSDYADLKQSWGMRSGYDGWFAGPLNNAQIASVASNTQQVSAFQALLAQEQGDLRRFYAVAKQLAKLPKEDRDKELEVLAAQMTGATR